MKRTFKLEGLDCANCAAKIETSVKKIDGVITASVNFMTTKMVIEAEDARMDAIEAAAIKVVKKIESDVKIIKV